MPSSAERFVTTHRESWQRLDSLVKKAKNSSIHLLKNEEIEEVGVLYRRAAADLARAQTRYNNSSAGRELVRSLNDLLLSAHTLVHASTPANPAHAWEFVLYGFPAAFRRQWRAIAISALFMMIPALIAYIAVLSNPASAPLFVPDSAIQQVQQRAKKKLITGWGGNNDFQGLLASPAISSFIMANNIKVSLGAVALGVTMGIGTAFMLITNGLMLGGLAAVATNFHVDLLFWAVILPHGILELTAISIAGGAGFLLAKAIFAPGALLRSDALRLAGKEAVLLLCGVAMMLVVAGTIEGFITPLPFPPYSKLAFAILTAIGLVAYLKIEKSREFLTS
ncbi:MAG: stage II sporulation protein M [Abditibacteriaceae bacterium]